MYARVILSLKNKEVDKVFDYIVPQEYCPICVGVRVIVPFGKGNKNFGKHLEMGGSVQKGGFPQGVWKYYKSA